MKLYLISQDINNRYDTYDSAVVVAESEYEAKRTHPDGFATYTKNGKWIGTYKQGGEYEYRSNNWVEPDDVEKVSVKYLGETDLEKGVVLASFNAG